MNELLVDRLKKARAESGLKQQDVAAQLGLKANTISNWEKGRTEPDIDSFVKLCDIYDVDCAALLSDVYAFKRIGTDISLSEFDHIKKYRSLDPHGQQTVDIILDREAERVNQLLDASKEITALKSQLSQAQAASRFFAYYGRIAAAGTSVEFSGITAGTKSFPESELNKNADYVIGVSGNSMEPEYCNGDIVYVQKTDHIETGEIGIFQKGSSIYIKKAGEDGLISLNPDYPPLTADGDRITILGKVLGKAEED